MLKRAFLIALAVGLFSVMLGVPIAQANLGGAFSAPSFNGTVTVPTSITTTTCNTLFLLFGSQSSTTGICDNGGGTRPVWRANNTSIFEGSTSVGLRAFLALSTTNHLGGVSTVMVNTGGGTATAVTVSGTDVQGTITLTSAGAATVVMTFASSFNVNPVCIISPANSAAGAAVANTFVSAISTTGWTVTFATQTAGVWNYQCMGN